jgi:hypothetical protein
MERKECNAEGKTYACQKKKKLYFIYVLLNFHKNIIHIKCDYLKKRRNLFKNDLYLES